MSDTKTACPVCKARGKPCERFVSAKHVFEHYGVPIEEKPGDLIILSRHPRNP